MLAKEESEKDGHCMKKLNLIGRNVGWLRYQRGWTQDTLAAKLQLAGWMISRSTISKIERGLTHVYAFQLFIFAECLMLKRQYFSQKLIFNPSTSINFTLTLLSANR
jgi:transcriptional regulator with XRE-family HTH domain